jgi:hypothetical protein
MSITLNPSVGRLGADQRLPDSSLRGLQVLWEQAISTLSEALLRCSHGTSTAALDELRLLTGIAIGLGPQSIDKVRQRIYVKDWNIGTDMCMDGALVGISTLRGGRHFRGIFIVAVAIAPRDDLSNSA